MDRIGQLWTENEDAGDDAVYLVLDTQIREKAPGWTHRVALCRGGHVDLIVTFEETTRAWEEDGSWYRLA